MSYIDFDRSSGRTISAHYDLPANSDVVLVNKTSGKPLAAPVTHVAAAGTGTLSIPLPASVPAGDYYLKAIATSGGAYIAQSVGFHVPAA